MALTTPAEAIAAIDAALASGELTIEYAGRRVTYRSVQELQASREHFARQAAAATPGQPAPAARERTSYATFARD